MNLAVRAAKLADRESPAVRRSWLYSIATAIEARSHSLASLADRESALGVTRLRGEVARTAGQLRFYGDVASEGSYLGIVIDDATDERGQIVRINRPLGPIAVFGASNFPFAFGVLGNDTASAIAAGCSVIVKAHPAHVSLCLEQVKIAQRALSDVGAPTGLLTVVVGEEPGAQLVRASAVTAVAFTGSQQGGMALWKIANERPSVIPVYAEMGTVNPVVVTRAASRVANDFAQGFVNSFTAGSGQFCTKPGIVFVPRDSSVKARIIAEVNRTAEPTALLTQVIAHRYQEAIHTMAELGARIHQPAQGPGSGWTAWPAIVEIRGSHLLDGGPFIEECFGPLALICEYASDAELHSLLEVMQPALAASIFAAVGGDQQAAALVELLASKVGRVIVNGFPTGVAYTWSQQHGGPWPATTAPAETSVGAAALRRFVRPVAFQGVSDDFLPCAALAENPWRLPRRVNGTLTV